MVPLLTVTRTFLPSASVPARTRVGFSVAALARLKRAVIDEQNVFAVLMDAVRVCSLGQITHALFEVGGQYRRNM